MLVKLVSAPNQTRKKDKYDNFEPHKSAPNNSGTDFRDGTDWLRHDFRRQLTCQKAAQALGIVLPSYNYTN